MSDAESHRDGVPLIEDLSDAPEPHKTKTSKRKRVTGGDDDVEDKKVARRRKRTKKKPQDVHAEALDSALGVNLAIAHLDSRLMADHIAQRTRRFHPDLSLVEAEDMHISGRDNCSSGCGMDS